MSTIHIEPAQKADPILPLVQAAIEGEIARLGLALKMSDDRLAPFERKYGVTSEHFVSEMAAEDLEGGDNEYVHWAGEYQLRHRLQEKLERLREIS